MKNKLPYKIFMLGLLMALAACKGKQQALDSTSMEQSLPTWVQDRPNSSEYYIGIGVASKKEDPTNYPSTAKQMALADLASEIEVKVDANSILYSIEKNDDFKEEYLSTTKLNSNLDLEGYERIDSWENDEYYYAFYRLSKAFYAEMKEKERQEAANKAASYLQEARIKRAEKQVSGSLNNYLFAFNAVRNFLGEALMINDSEEDSYIGTLLYKEISDLLNDIEMSTPEDVVVFNILNRNEQSGLYINNSKGQGLPNLPFKIKVENQLLGRIVTASNNVGFISLSTNELKTKKLVGTLTFELLLNNMVSEALKNDPLIIAYLKQFKSPLKRLPYKTILPNLYVQSTEINFDDNSIKILLNKVRQSAAMRGFNIVEEEKFADVKVLIEGKTKEGSVQYDLYTSLLDLKIDFVTTKNNDLLYTYNLIGRKGVGMNYQVAGEKAYSKTAEKIHTELFPSFLKSLGY